ncbi:MAG: metal-sulfur cluster assembly factor [Alphaproteobacteria bacterium]
MTSRAAIWDTLGGVADPCMAAVGLDLSVVDLGLIYDVDLDDGHVSVTMTFTEIGCQFTHVVVSGSYDAIEALPGVASVKVVPCWEPLWTEARLTEKAASALALSGVALHRLKRHEHSLKN